MHVHAVPCEAQNFLLAPPRVIRKYDHWSQLERESSPECHKLVVLEKPSPYIALLQHRDVGLVADLRRARLEAEVEHAFEGSQLSIDRSVSVAVFLSSFDIEPYLISSNIRNAHPTKEALQMLDTALGFIQ